MDLYIVGAGGFGRECLDVVRAMGLEAPEPVVFRGFLDDGAVDQAILDRLGAAVVGTTSSPPSVDAGFVIGVGSGAVRQAIDERLVQLGLRAVTLVHPSVTCGADVVLGEGNVICSHTSITTNIRFGRHVHLNLNTTVGHDSHVGDYVTVNPGATISGDVRLEDGVSVGTGANILQGLRIGAGATVGAGAVVTKDVAPGVTVAGVPARPLA